MSRKAPQVTTARIEALVETLLAILEEIDPTDGAEGDDQEMWGESDQLENGEGDPAEEERGHALTPQYYARLRKRRQAGAPFNNASAKPSMPVLYDPDTGEPFQTIWVDVR